MHNTLIINQQNALRTLFRMFQTGNGEIHGWKARKNNSITNSKLERQQNIFTVSFPLILRPEQDVLHQYSGSTCSFFLLWLMSFCWHLARSLRKEKAKDFCRRQTKVSLRKESKGSHVPQRHPENYSVINQHRTDTLAKQIQFMKVLENNITLFCCVTTAKYLLGGGKSHI